MCKPDVSSQDDSDDRSTPLTSDTSTRHQQQPQQPQAAIIQRGFMWGATSMGLALVATTMSMPYSQDKRNALGCDNMCQGSMNAARSALQLVGAALVGRLSDATWLHAYGGGRRVCLGLGLVGTAVSLILTTQASSVTQLWYALVPYVLQQNMSVMKALFSDYHAYLESTSTQRASTAGLLGMVGGLAMMLGPLVGSSLLANMQQATAVSLLFLSLAAVCTLFVPSIPLTTKATNGKKSDDMHNNNSTALWSLLDVPSARSPPAMFLLTARLLSTLSFHIFSTISTPSLKQRFDFGPTEYGQFFSFIGFCFAASQYIAPYLIRGMSGGVGSSSSYRTHIFCTALAVMGLGRYLAFGTADVYAMYAYYAVVVLATGVVSTLFAADTSQVAAPGEAGAFFGVVTAIESGAGMVGPLVGGSLAKLSINDDATTAPLVATSSLITLMGTMVWFGYEPFVLSHIAKSKKKTE